jgi:hypothetical protein
MEGRKTTSGIEYCFRAFGVVTILCIERKMNVGDDSERLNAIAQVIAECQGQSCFFHALVVCWFSHPCKIHSLGLE